MRVSDTGGRWGNFETIYILSAANELQRFTPLLLAKKPSDIKRVTHLIAPFVSAGVRALVPPKLLAHARGCQGEAAQAFLLWKSQVARDSRGRERLSREGPFLLRSRIGTEGVAVPGFSFKSRSHLPPQFRSLCAHANAQRQYCKHSHFRALLGGGGAKKCSGVFQA